MRLISQDGMADMPYEHGSLSIYQKQSNGSKFAIHFRFTNTAYGINVADYSSEEKALKVMQILREAYVGLPIIIQNVEVEESVIEKLKNTNVIMANLKGQPGSIEYINKGYFKFPKDEDVEV